MSQTPASQETKSQAKPFRLVIEGGRPLDGEIRVGGMKNAATPIVAATLLVKEPVRLENVPRLSDVERMLDILRSLGATAEWTGPHELMIDTALADLSTLDAKAVKSMRSSVLLMGPLLSRYHEVAIPEPGGCIIGNRPIDYHLDVLGGLGAEIRCDREKGLYTLKAAKLVGTKVIPAFSVTATENAVMAATLAEGRTVVKVAAAEPHVEDLCRFLNAAGARIQGLGTHTLVIDGVERLHGVTHRIIPDQIEAGTFMALGAVTKGSLRITGIDADQLDMVFRVMRQAGAVFEAADGAITMGQTSTLDAFKLQTMPYPGFPTDLQQPFGVVATQCRGTTLIHDTIYEGRLGYVNELIKMGANAVICDPHRVLVTGPTPLYGQEIKGLDLRAGATMVIAGLVASGETVIHGAEVIDRGYERIDERLQAVGAEIERVY
jgi:UDP-N-acetylglucosamine 1-carboxyvinyltransferase